MTKNRTNSIAAGLEKMTGGVRSKMDAKDSAPASIPKCFRRLKWDEVVRRGDFMANNGHGLEPWEGPTGFRADAFLKPIYRKKECGPAEVTESP